MSTYPEVTVDIEPPNSLLIYYRVHGVFALLFNLIGVLLIVKNRRIVRLYRNFMINMQVLSMIADAQNTLLMQPVYLFPVLAGYTNGIWWHLFGLSSHFQMGIFLLLLYLQVAAIVCAIVIKYQVLASIGNKTYHPYLFWFFVIFYHSCAFLIFTVFCFADLSRSQEEELLRTKFPNAMNILTLSNIEIYDMMMNKWMFVTACSIIAMLLSAIIISVTFSVFLFKTLKLKKKIISTRNYLGHRIAVTSLMAQSTIPFVVIVLPIGCLVYFFFHIMPNTQNIANAMMGIYSFHSTLSTSVMILSNKEYRKLIKQRFKNTTVGTTPVQMTRVMRSANCGTRLKKLSRPEI